MSSPIVECNICAEECKHVVSCPYCQYESCISCTQTFLLSKTQAQCMACKANWNNNFLRLHLPLDWIEKDYKTHVKSILFDREKNFMPQTSDYVRDYKRLQELEKSLPSYQIRISQIRAEKQDLVNEVEHLSEVLGINKKLREYRKYESKLYQKYQKDRTAILVKWSNQPQSIENRQASQTELNNLQAKYLQSTTEFRKKNPIPKLDLPDLYHDLETEQNILNIYMHEYHQIKSSVFNTQVKSEVVRNIKCKFDDCKGFLKDSRCNICQKLFCNECQEVKSDEHVCNPDILASIKLIKAEKNVKPCPGCGVGVNKLDGCDHMWCIMCKTGFSWNTGKVIDDSQNTNGEMVKFYRSKNLYHVLYNPQGQRSDSGQNQNCDTRKSYYDIMNTINTLFRQHGTSKLIKKIQQLREKNCSSPEIEFFDHIKSKWFIIEFTIELATIFNDRDRHKIAEPNQYSNSLNHKLRLKFLTNEIDEKNFNIQAMKNVKRIEYENEIANFIETSFLYLNDWVNSVYSAFSKVRDGWDVALNAVQKIDWTFPKQVLKQFNLNCCETSKLYNYTVYKKINILFGKTSQNIKEKCVARNWDVFYRHFSDEHLQCYKDIQDRKHLYWGITIKSTKNKK